MRTMTDTSKNILYPETIDFKPSTEFETELPAVFTVPGKSWNFIEDELKTIFGKIGRCKPSNIFVFSNLKNGRISFDDDFCIYTDSDCPVEDEHLVKDDDVCSEEFGAEILMPFFNKMFPGVQVNQFLTVEENKYNREFFFKVCREYEKSLIFISRNREEVPLWPEHLQD